MYKDKFDKLVASGVISELEKEKIYSQMSPNSDGHFTGFNDSKIDYKYYVNGDIFNDNLCDFVVNHCVPPLGMEYIDETFKTYGMTCSGICDRWSWFKKDNITQYTIDKGHKPVEDASDTELWKMLAMSSMYWVGNYKEWKEKDDPTLNLLHRFMGEWERKYFGYDPDGYTMNTIDKILNKVDDILNEKFKMAKEEDNT